MWESCGYLLYAFIINPSKCDSWYVAVASVDAIHEYVYDHNAIRVPLDGIHTLLQDINLCSMVRELSALAQICSRKPPLACSSYTTWKWWWRYSNAEGKTCHLNSQQVTQVSDLWPVLLTFQCMLSRYSKCVVIVEYASIQWSRQGMACQRGWWPLCMEAIDWGT